MMVINNVFLKALVDDLDKQLNLLIEELSHMSYVINFFYKPRVRECAFRTLIFKSIREIASNCREATFALVKDWKALKEDLNGAFELKEVEGFDFYQRFFNDFINIKNRIKILLAKFDFLQKKLLSHQSSSQHYYPMPKVTSFREAIKIHVYMEHLTKDFFKLFLPSSKEVNVSFFWDYSPEVKFLRDRRGLVVNTDFFLPHRQAYWIILSHEVLHYLLLEFDSFNAAIFSELNSYIDETINDCRIALVKVGFEYLLDPNMIKDVFIDSILSFILGVPFLLPISVRLFAFDEVSFNVPYVRTWKIRLSVLSNLFSSEKDRFKKDLYAFLNIYEKYQQKSSRTIIDGDFFVIEQVVESVLKKRIEYLLFSKRVYFSFFYEKLRRWINQNKNKVEKKESLNKWLKAYLNYANLFTYKYLNALEDKDVSKEYKKKEGRAICYAFQELCCGKEVLEETIEEGFKTNVYRLNLFKLRFDVQGFLFEKFNHYNWLFGVSSYNVLSLERRQVFEKVDVIQNQEKTKALLDALFNESNGLEVEKNEILDETFLIKEKIPFYKEELSLTLFSKNHEIDFSDVIDKQNDYVLVLVKLQADKLKEDKISCWKYLQDIFVKEIGRLGGSIKDNLEVFVFSSFDWFDYLVFLAFDVSKMGDFLLDDVLRTLKSNVILKNKLLKRTETSIFVGKKVFGKVILPDINIIVRVSSDDLGRSHDFIVNLRSVLGRLNFDGKVYSAFGIRDIVIHTNKGKRVNELLDALKEIFDKTQEEGIRISDVQVEPFISWDSGSESG